MDEALARAWVAASASYRASSSEADRRLLVAYADRAATGDWVAAEYQRFLDTAHRVLPGHRGAESLAGRRILVTGGTGQIASELLPMLLSARADVRSWSRGKSRYAPIPGVDYVTVDVRDSDAVTRELTAYRPHVVFHLAAVRSPREAEQAPERAIQTNIAGTAHVVAAARDAGVRRLVYASTGKAVRLYTEDVYAASKKVSEWVVAGEAAAMQVASARFTHVVDNSLIHQKLQREMARGELTLHAPHMAMFAQSAKESAQLLVEAAGVDAPCAMPVLSLRDLGPPFDLTELALGLRARSERSVPLVFEGYEPGYEETPYPALYDRRVGETGPLVNRFEAQRTETVCAGAVNRFLKRPRAMLPEIRHVVARCRAPYDPVVLKAILNNASSATLSADLSDEAPSSIAEVLSLADLQGVQAHDHRVTSALLRAALSSAHNPGSLDGAV